MKITVNIALDEDAEKLLERIAVALEQIAENTKPEPPVPTPSGVGVVAS